MTFPVPVGYVLVHDQKSNLVNGHQMVTPGRTPYRERAVRILDAAAELVLRWGYQRVTMQDVARHADVGKGTLYLHWRTREALFVAVLLRESLGMVDTLLERIEDDPATILLHRMQKVCFEVILERPLLRAVYGGDSELLGVLTRQAELTDRERQAAFLTEYLTLLRERGLLRTDTDLETQAYAINCTVNGFNLTGALTAAELPLPGAARATALADTLRAAFEPGRPPGDRAVRQVAPLVVTALETLRDSYARQQFGDHDHDEEALAATRERS